MAADIRYVKLAIDVFEDEKIDHILQLENGDAIFLIWFRLFLKVKKKGTDVFSTFSDVETPINKVLSIILDEPVDLIDLSISVLTNLEMLEVKDNEIKVIVPWLPNQYYRTTPAYINWRNEVYLRDDFTCQHCRIRGHKLNAHHIKSFAEYKESRYEVSNGITLCEECHRKVHKKKEKGE